MNRNCRRALALVLALCMVLGFFPGGLPTARANDNPVSYLDYDADGKPKSESSSCDEYKTISSLSDKTKWGTSENATWYVVSESESIAGRVTVEGKVHLILVDGKTLTASAGITVNEGNSLTIYAQSNGDTMGKLNADFDDEYEDEDEKSGGAGIGGDNNKNGGTIDLFGNPGNAGLAWDFAVRR